MHPETGGSLNFLNYLKDVGEDFDFGVDLNEAIKVETIKVEKAKQKVLKNRHC